MPRRVLVIAGSRKRATREQVLSALGAESRTPADETVLGLPAVRLQGGAADGALVLFKPGDWGDADALARVTHRLPESGDCIAPQ